MTIEVIGPDAREVWTLEVTSYTTHADSTLDVALGDGSVRLAGSWRPPETPAWLRSPLSDR